MTRLSQYALLALLPTLSLACQTTSDRKADRLLRLLSARLVEVEHERDNVRLELAAAKTRLSDLTKELEWQERRSKLLETHDDPDRVMRAESVALQKELALLREEKESLELMMQAYEMKYSRGSCAPPPPIDALVEDVDPSHQLVVLSVGRDQEVKVGYEFTVYRGSDFLGKVRVTKVFDDCSGAEIVFTKDGVSVQPGDRASTDIRSGAVLN